YKLTQRSRLMKSNRIILIVLVFVCFSHGLYMFFNAAMFKTAYEKQSVAQLQELGEVVQNEIAYALGFGIPIQSLGGMTPFLKDILENTPELAYIHIRVQEKILFAAQRDTDAIREIIIPIPDSAGIGPDNSSQAGEICLGLGKELNQKMVSMLFDLITIVIAGLIITYEIIRFFASKLVVVPFRESIHSINTMIRELHPYHPPGMPPDFYRLTARVRQLITVRTQQVHQVLANINQACALFLSHVFYGRNAFLQEVKNQRTALLSMMIRQDRIKTAKDPSQIRPIVFIFFLGANLQASFLPLFSRELLAQKTILSGIFSDEILMGLPITCYMIAIFIFMLFMGSNFFRRWISLDHAIGIGTFCTSAGLVFCGLSNDILQLIFGRILCAVGFAFIVIYCKQFIVEHATQKNQAFHLAGFTAAFSGGLFCSIIIGSILVEYFSYQFVFFAAAAMVLLIFVFDYMILADKAFVKEVIPDKKNSGHDAAKIGLTVFFQSGIRDMNLICVMLHGIITRIIFIGYFYYALPILLQPNFVYSDIGRIMMFYTLPSVLLAGFLNRRIRQIRHSRIFVIAANMLVGSVLMLFYFVTAGPVSVTAVFVIITLLILGITNSITFPAQSGLLLHTRTAKKTGTRTALSVYNSFERVGSALGPVFFGFFAGLYDIHTAIVLGGVLCIIGNMIFFFCFRPEA
ncbi:MAG: MFS transporter, partial [Desulfobacteraceae bacterium]|nr:MFS transporter [Desulfobacteraceae bacterium]